MEPATGRERLVGLLRGAAVARLTTLDLYGNSIGDVGVRAGRVGEVVVTAEDAVRDAQALAATLPAPFGADLYGASHAHVAVASGA